MNEDLEDPRSMHYTLEDVVEQMKEQKTEILRLRTLLSFASGQEVYVGTPAYKAYMAACADRDAALFRAQELQRINIKLANECERVGRAISTQQLVLGVVRAKCVAATPVQMAGPRDCTVKCKWGPCDCSGVPVPTSWDLDPQAIIALLDSPMPFKGGLEYATEAVEGLVEAQQVSRRVVEALGGPEALLRTVWDFDKPADGDKPTTGGSA